MAPKYMVVRPGPGPVAKYMVVRPGPGPVAKYMVVRPGPGPVAKYMVVRPDPGPVAKYMVVHPGPGPGGGPIVAKYMVVPPGIVPMYVAQPPWAGVDAHQAVINKVTADGKLSKKEAVLLRKLFNRDIKEAAAVDKDIRSKVAAYLHKVLDKLKLDPGAKDLIFGLGGPGYTRPIIVAKYLVRGPGVID